MFILLELSERIGLLHYLMSFTKLFDITEEDGMYVAPENRVSIW